MTTYSQAQFDLAVKTVGDLPKGGSLQPTQDDQLTFYKYFKQANVGDVPEGTSRPGFLDFAGRAKFDAWTSVKGTSSEEARSKYVERLLKMLDGATKTKDVDPDFEAVAASIRAA